MLKDSLPPKQKRFVEEYVIDRNATAAYIRAGYNSDGNTASVCASQLLSEPKIREAIDELIDQVSERCGIIAERVSDSKYGYSVLLGTGQPALPI